MRVSLRPRRTTGVPQGLDGVRAALACACCAGFLAGAGCTTGASGSAGSGTAGATADAVVAARATRAAPAKPAARERFDPMRGEYPVVQWMISEREADAPLPPGDRPSHRVIAAERVQATIEAMQALPGASRSVDPCILTTPGQMARISMQSRDKAGQSVRGSDFSFVATIDGDAVVSDVTINGHRPPPARVCEGGALVVCEPSTTAPGRWSIVMLRPSVLRSVDDYPFQTAPAIGGAADTSN